MNPLPPRSTLFPYTTLFRSKIFRRLRLRFSITRGGIASAKEGVLAGKPEAFRYVLRQSRNCGLTPASLHDNFDPILRSQGDRKSTRLNSSHGYISYAVFCLK